MSRVGFDPATMTTSEIQAVPEIMSTIHILFGIVPGVLYASCAILLAFYNIDKPTLEIMKKELEERRTAEQ